MSVLAWLLFLAIGISAGWEDIRHRRVSNRWIAAGLAGVALGYAALGLNTFLGLHGRVWGGMGEYYLPATFYQAAAFHVFLSVAASLALWYLRIWPAGDAKLFIACSALLTLMNQRLRGFPDRLFFLALCNIFMAAAFFVLGGVLWEWAAIASGLRFAETRKRLKSFAHRAWVRLLDERRRAPRYALFAWNTFALFFVARVLWTFVAVGRGLWGALAAYLLLYSVWGRIQNCFLRRDVASGFFFLVTAVVLPWDFYRGWRLFPQLQGGSWLTFGFWFFLPTARMVLDYYLESTRLVTVETDALSGGMILSERSFRRVEALAAEAVPPVQYCDGLTSEEAASIRGALRAGGDATVEIRSPKPFAPWVFFGCLWTALSQRTILECVMRWL